MARVIGNLKKIPKLGPKGKDGRDAPSIEEILRLLPTPRDGTSGKDGASGTKGTDGRDGQDGLRGPQGFIGPKGDSLSIGEITPLVEALIESELKKIPKPPQAVIQRGGGQVATKYVTTITEATYTINKSQLTAGVNIFGVNFAGDVTVKLPPIHERVKDKIIIINDESGLAGTNNITIQVV